MNMHNWNPPKDIISESDHGQRRFAAGTQPSVSFDLGRQKVINYTLILSSQNTNHSYIFVHNIKDSSWILQAKSNKMFIKFVMLLMRTWCTHAPFRNSVQSHLLEKGHDKGVGPWQSREENIT